MKPKFTSQTSRTLTRNTILLSITALALWVSPGSRADALCGCVSRWTGSTGDWFNPSNWSYLVPDCGGHCIIGGEPIEADVNNGGTAQITTPTPTAYACEVFLGKDAGEKGNLSVNHGTLNQCNDMWVGYHGKGTLSITNGGVVSTDVGASIASYQNSSGTVAVDGANSQWTITGTNGLSLGGTINSSGGAGLLTVTNGGTVSASSAHVYKSGTLTGNGTINTTSGTTIEGTLKPSSGRLTVGGNLAFAGTAPVMQSNVVPASADNVYVSAGAESLTGRLSVTMTGTFTPGTTYTLLHADNGLLGTTFSSVSLTFPPGQGWSPAIIYDANNVKLNLVPNTGP